MPSTNIGRPSFVSPDAQFSCVANGTPCRNFPVARSRNVVKTVTIRLHHQLPWRSIDRRIHQHRDLRPIPVHHVMRCELKMPLQLPGIRVKRDNRIAVQIVALPDITVEIRRRVPNRPIQQVQLWIVASGQPCGATRMHPRVPRPALRARLARPRDAVEPPCMRPRLRIVSIHPAIQAAVTV